MIKEVLYTLIILAAIPTGFILAKLCKEELQIWKRRFTYIVIISLVLIPIIYITDFQHKIPIIITLTYTTLTLITTTYKAEK